MLRRTEMNLFSTDWQKQALKWLAVGATLVALILVSAIVINNAVATPVSPRETQIRGWVNNLADQGLTASRQEAQQQLEAAGEEAVPALLTALRSNNPAQRANAADLLGYIASARASEGLQQTLSNDPAPAVRANAAWALGEIKSAGAYNALERASVLDTSAQVRESAGEALQSVQHALAQRAGLDPAKVNAAAVAPNSADVIYLASQRDLLVSQNGGAQWQTLTQALPGLTSALTVNPTNSNILYAGMHSQGMYLSTDGGRTWQSLTRNFSNQAIGESTVTAIAVDPANPMRVVMAHGIRIGSTGNQFFPLGILSSKDGGQTWGYVLDLQEGQLVTRMAVKDNKLYALTGDRVLIAPLAN